MQLRIAVSPFLKQQETERSRRFYRNFLGAILDKITLSLIHIYPNLELLDQLLTTIPEKTPLLIDADGLNSVSYTHLDVYKRQVVGRG